MRRAIFARFITATVLAAAATTPLQFSAHYLDLGAAVTTQPLVAAGQAGNFFVVSVLSGAGNAAVIRVTKTDAAGNVLATVDFGGSGQNFVNAAAIDPMGNLVIGGATTSPDFPLTGALQSTGGAFLTKIDPQFLKIVYSTRLGTDTNSTSVITSAITAVAFDSAGNTYVAGTAGPGLPVTAGALQAQAPASSVTGQVVATHAFVAEISATGSQLIFSTYYTGIIGGAALCGPPFCFGPIYVTTSPAGIALDSSGNVIIAGNTNVSDLMVTPNSYATKGTTFAAKIGSAGTKLIWGTYLPANSIAGVALDGSGNILFYGNALSGFPVTADALQPAFPPVADPRFAVPEAGFLGKLDPSGSRLLYATYFGGNQGLAFTGDSVTRMAVDRDGVIWLTGASTAAALPAGANPVLGSNYVAAVSADGGNLLALYTAPEGASGEAIAVAPDGTIATLGKSNSLLIAKRSPGPSIMGIAGAFAFTVSAAVAPRELVSIYGIGIGPAAALPVQVVSGVIGNSLGGVEVLFDGTPAALLYAGPSQINAIVPSAVAGKATTFVQIVTPSGITNGPTLAIRNAVPLVAARRVGSSTDALALNEDGTLNSALNPARAGSIVAIWMTGVAGPGVDNSFNAAPDSNAIPISVITASGQSLEILYAGDAPQQPNGVTQVNFRMPDKNPNPNDPISFSITAAEAQSDLFSIYVR